MRRNQCEYLGRFFQEHATSLLTPCRVTSHSWRDILEMSLSGPSSRRRMLKCMAQIAVYIAHLRGAKTPVKIAGTQPAEHLGPRSQVLCGGMMSFVFFSNQKGTRETWHAIFLQLFPFLSKTPECASYWNFYNDRVVKANCRKL